MQLRGFHWCGGGCNLLYTYYCWRRRHFRTNYNNVLFFVLHTIAATSTNISTGYYIIPPSICRVVTSSLPPPPPSVADSSNVQHLLLRLLRHPPTPSPQEHRLGRRSSVLLRQRNHCNNRYFCCSNSKASSPTITTPTSQYHYCFNNKTRYCGWGTTKHASHHRRQQLQQQRRWHNRQPRPHFTVSTVKPLSSSSSSSLSVLSMIPSSASDERRPHPTGMPSSTTTTTTTTTTVDRMIQQEQILQPLPEFLSMMMMRRKMKQTNMEALESILTTMLQLQQQPSPSNRNATATTTTTGSRISSNTTDIDSNSSSNKKIKGNSAIQADDDADTISLPSPQQQLVLILGMVRDQLQQFLNNYHDTSTTAVTANNNNNNIPHEDEIDVDRNVRNIVGNDNDETDNDDSGISTGTTGGGDTIIRDLSDCIAQTNQIFCTIAMESTKKDTRIKLRQMATSLLLVPETVTISSSSSVLTLSLIVASLCIQSILNKIVMPHYTTNDDTDNDRNSSKVSTLSEQQQQILLYELQHHQQLQLCRSAASAILSTINDALVTQQQQQDSVDLGNSAVLKELVLSILKVHRDNYVSNIASTFNTDTDRALNTQLRVNTDNNVNNNNKNCNIDFHIVTGLARILRLDDCFCFNDEYDNDDDVAKNNFYTSNTNKNELLSDMVTFAIANGLQQLSRGTSNNNSNNPNIATLLLSSSSSLQITDVSTMFSYASQLRPSNMGATTTTSASTSNSNNPYDSLTSLLAFAAQFRPWHTSKVDPNQLVLIAMDHGLWHSAEIICTSVIGRPTTATGNSQTLLSLTGTSAMGIEPILTYIDIALQRRAHRQADKIATTFFDALATAVTSTAAEFAYNSANFPCDGSNSSSSTYHHLFVLERYFLNARYLHACNTIVKLIRKGAIPVIERQVERIDQSVIKVAAYTDYIAKSSVVVTHDTEPYYEGGTTLESASTDIRNFALHQLEESENMETAQRLASIWDMEYIYDPERMKVAEQKRRIKYLQWEDAFPKQKKIPYAIATAKELEDAMKEMNRDHPTIYGFDVEWGSVNTDDEANQDIHDKTNGAALLQIATMNHVVLVDIPKLSKTLFGVEALERYIYPLFYTNCTDTSNSDTSTNESTTIPRMIGFSCREDILRLRNSPCIRSERHWFPVHHHDTTTTSSVIDLQTLIAQMKIDSFPATKDHFGLSSVCAHFLKKPLDKSEQCSDWNRRPLTLKQRIYAALDAFVCVQVYHHILTLKSVASK